MVPDCGRKRYDQVEKAEVALVEALRIKRQVLKKEDSEARDDSDVAATLEALALAYTKQGKYDKAESVYEQVMAIKEGEYGPHHWEVARTLHHRCLLMLAKGPEHYDAALPLAESLVEVCFFSPSSFIHSSLTGSLVDRLYRRRGALSTQMLAWHSVSLPSLTFFQGCGANLMMNSDTLGQVYLGLKRYSEADTVFKHSLRIKMDTVGPSHSSVAATVQSPPITSLCVSSPTIHSWITWRMPWLRACPSSRPPACRRHSSASKMR